MDAVDVDRSMVDLMRDLDGGCDVDVDVDVDFGGWDGMAKDTTRYKYNHMYRVQYGL